jgi:hypothetical protein
MEKHQPVSHCMVVVLMPCTEYTVYSTQNTKYKTSCNATVHFSYTIIEKYVARLLSFAFQKILAQLYSF